MSEETRGGIHWSFWVIGVVTLLFNLIGVANFITQMNAENVAAMPDAYRAIIESRPAWATGAFAVAVCAGAIGCLLLLLRKSAAYYMFIASLVGAIVAQIPVFGEVAYPSEAVVGGLSQMAVTAFLIWFSKRSEQKGWIS